MAMIPWGPVVYVVMVCHARLLIATCKTESLFLYSPIKSETYSLHNCYQSLDIIIIYNLCE